MDIVQRRRFSMGSPIQIEGPTRRTRATGRLVPSCPTLTSPAMKPQCSPSTSSKTCFLALKGWKSSVLSISLTEDKLTLSAEQMNEVLEAWNKVEEHEKQPQQFNQLYRTHWSICLYCSTKRTSG